MTTNIVKAAFGECRETVTRKLYQYDYGQVLEFSGLDLPQAYEVHFGNSPYTGETVTQIGSAEGVTIPDRMLLKAIDIYAWVFLHTGNDDGETRYLAKIPVEARPKPSNREPEPVEQDAITQAIAVLNAAVEQTAASEAAASAKAAEAAASASAAQTSAANAAAAKTAAETAQGKAEEAQTAAEAAKTAAASSASTATAQATAAAASASTASTKAAEAAASASAAQTSAANAAAAKTAAETAQGKTEAAQTAAETAKTAAQTAATNAGTAKTAAETAQGKAEAAQTAAESARAAAEAAAATLDLQVENIPDTVQTITFDGNGNVSQIVHTDGNNVAIRTDVFTFAANSITEVRTLNTGESLTIVTDTDTLTTTVTYAAA